MSTDDSEREWWAQRTIEKLDIELDAATARAEKAEAELTCLRAENQKLWNEKTWCERDVMRAEAALQKIRDVMREDSNGKDPMDAVENIIAAMKEESK